MQGFDKAEVRLSQAVYNLVSWLYPCEKLGKQKKKKNFICNDMPHLRENLTSCKLFYKYILQL